MPRSHGGQGLDPSLRFCPFASQNGLKRNRRNVLRRPSTDAAPAGDQGPGVEGAGCVEESALHPLFCVSYNFVPRSEVGTAMHTSIAVDPKGDGTN
eukprot:4405896-Amphidinium_carterae.2